MSIGTITPITTVEGLESLPNDELRLTARAALAAGYATEVRHIRYEFMIFANGKHFYPLSNWGQCVRLVVDTHTDFAIVEGSVMVSNVKSHEYRTPTTDAEYYTQMCEAVVTNTAKGCPF